MAVNEQECRSSVNLEVRSVNSELLPSELEVGIQPRSVDRVRKNLRLKSIAAER